jgi:hypothetical protein
MKKIFLILIISFLLSKNTMPLFNIHSGSWGIGGFRLPDLGITEKISDFSNRVRTGQGGSDLIPNLPTPGNYNYNPTLNKAFDPNLTPQQFVNLFSQPQSTNKPVLTQPPNQPKPTTKPTNTGGNTGGGGGGGGARGITASEALAKGWDLNNLPAGYYLIREGGGGGDDYANRIRSNIESGFNQYLAYLDRISGLIPQMQQEQQGYISQQFESMLGQLGTEKQAAEQQLQTYRQDVEARKQAGLEEIAQNLRNLIKATGMQLGAMGAGSSSAAQVIAPYALAKQGSRAQAQVIKGANEQLAEIDRKMIDVQKTYDTQKSQIEQWRAEKMAEIGRIYNDLKFQIEQAKAKAPIEKMNALNNLDYALLQNALQMANYYEQTANQYRMSLDQWVRDRISQLQNFKIQLSQSANFNPVELTYDALRGLQGQPQASYEFYNPVLIQQIRKRLGLAQ